MSTTLARVKQFKDVEFEYDAVAGGTLFVYTDMPGVPMALKRTMAVPASVGTRTYVFPLDEISQGTILEGTLIKFRITSTGIVRLFNAALRVRPIGVFFNGANGEIWETLELSFGI
jgi:hypothetical protein